MEYLCKIDMKCSYLLSLIAKWKEFGFSVENICMSSGHHVLLQPVFVLQLGRCNDMDFQFFSPLLFICGPNLFLNNLVGLFFFIFHLKSSSAAFGILDI